MYEEERRLFARAIIEATDRHLDMALRDLPVATSFRRTHVRRMRHIVRYGTLPQTHTLSKRAWALIIAAALLLTGCAVLAREEIAGFFVTIMETRNEMDSSLNKTANCPTSIEEEKIPQMLPEGFEIFMRESHETFLSVTWVHSSGAMLIYSQYTQDSFNMGTDNEYSQFDELQLCGHTVLYATQNGVNNRYWWTEDYVYYIFSSEPLEQKELEEIIQSVR